MEFTKRQCEIIEKSIELIAEKGIQNLTIKNLSKKIGISEPAIYRHFENKFEILKAILNKFEKEIELNYKNMENNLLSADKKLEKIFDFHLKKFNSDHYYAAVIFSEELFKNSNELFLSIKNIMMFNMKKIVNIIKEGQNNGAIREDIKAEELATIFMGSLRFLVKEWVQDDFGFELISRGESLKKSLIRIVEKKDDVKEENNEI